MPMKMGIHCKPSHSASLDSRVRGNDGFPENALVLIDQLVLLNVGVPKAFRVVFSCVSHLLNNRIQAVMVRELPREISRSEGSDWIQRLSCAFDWL